VHGTPESTRAWLHALASGHATDEKIDLAFDRCRIEVRSNSKELIRKLAAYYRGFEGEPDDEAIRIRAIEAPIPSLPLAFQPKQPDPGKRLKEEFVDYADGRIVRKRLTGMLFLFGGGEHLAFGPCVENDNQIVNFINNRYIQYRLNQGYLLCHAAGVHLEGRGLALAGMSGMGKSTLALKTVALGSHYASNDRLMIRRSGGVLEMLGVPKLPRVNPGTVLNNPALEKIIPPDERAALGSLPPDELWGLEQKYDVFVDDCFGPGRFRLRSEMKGLAVLNWQRGGSPLVVRQVDLTDRTDLLDAFRKAAGLFYQPGDSGLAEPFTAADYLQVMGDCPVYELAGGVDFDDAAALCMSFLGTGRMPTGSRPLASSHRLDRGDAR
jgi:HprK-related kinase B